MRLDLRIFHRQGGVESQATPGIGIARDKEVHTNGSIGVSARLNLLSTRGGDPCQERARDKQKP